MRLGFSPSLSGHQNLCLPQLVETTSLVPVSLEQRKNGLETPGSLIFSILLFAELGISKGSQLGLSSFHTKVCISCWLWKTEYPARWISDMKKEDIRLEYTAWSCLALAINILQLENVSENHVLFPNLIDVFGPNRAGWLNPAACTGKPAACISSLLQILHIAYRDTVYKYQWSPVDYKWPILTIQWTLQPSLREPRELTSQW